MAHNQAALGPPGELRAAPLPLRCWVPPGAHVAVGEMGHGGVVTAGGVRHFRTGAFEPLEQPPVGVREEEAVAQFAGQLFGVTPIRIAWSARASCTSSPVPASGELSCCLESL